MCKKQTSVSHSSTEAEIISLDAGLRMDGVPALTLWDLVIEICYSVPNGIEQTKEELRGDPLQSTSSNASTPTSFQLTLTTFHPTQCIMVRVPCCMSLRTMRNEAVIKMIIKSRSLHNETCFTDPQSCS